MSFENLDHCEFVIDQQIIYLQFSSFCFVCLRVALCKVDSQVSQTTKLRNAKMVRLLFAVSVARSQSATDLTLQIVSVAIGTLVWTGTRVYLLPCPRIQSSWLGQGSNPTLSTLKSNPLITGGHTPIKFRKEYSSWATLNILSFTL